jgi:sugar phosphate isomerase/epimerase
MHYGAMNLPIKPVLEEIEELGKLGFDYIELTMDAPECTPEKILKCKTGIKDLVQTHGLGLIAHLPTFLSIADLYESIRKASVDENLKALEAGVELGIKKYVLHPGTIRGLGKQVKAQANKYADKSLMAILARARELQVAVCLENMFPETHGPTEVHDFETIFSKYNDLKLTLDLAHAHIGTSRNRSAEFIERYPGRLAHVHISDNYGREDNHLPIGAGMIYFGRIFKELKLIGYDDTMTIEVFSRDRDYLKLSREKVSQMWRAA